MNAISSLTPLMKGSHHHYTQHRVRAVRTKAKLKSEHSGLCKGGSPDSQVVALQDSVLSHSSAEGQDFLGCVDLWLSMMVLTNQCDPEFRDWPLLGKK